MNLSIVPGAVAALEAALSELMASSPAGFAQLEEAAKRMALASCAEALSRALEARDRELLASFPCAWSREGADAMVRVRSWLHSGFALPARTREGSRSRRRAARRDGRLASFVASRPGTGLESEGKGWEYPVSASLAGMRADVRYEAAGCPLG